MSNYPQEGFVTMEQYIAQFTGEEPAQIREHSRVGELEREVERLRAAISRISRELSNTVPSEWFDAVYTCNAIADKALNSE